MDLLRIQRQKKKTCSAARGKKIPAFERAGIPSPQPLRSESHPMGLPGLSGTNLARVQQANSLYHFTKDVVLLANSLDIPVSVENPANSWYWSLPPTVEFLAQNAGHWVTFSNCMHGGTRDKATHWWSTMPWFAPLSAMCTKDHNHGLWKPCIVDGKPFFPTSQEAAYPALLCQCVAEIVRAHCARCPLQQSIFGPESARLRLAFEKQPRRSRALVSEFAHYDPWAVPLEDPTATDKLLQCYLKGARVRDKYGLALCRIHPMTNSSRALRTSGRGVERWIPVLLRTKTMDLKFCLWHVAAQQLPGNCRDCMGRSS